MQIEEKVLEIISEYKKKTEKECYFINYNDEIPNILDDKIGGKPYLPIGEDYPIDKYGNPMALFIQINFKNLDLPNYPKGIFEIFITTNEDDIFGALELDKECYAIRFFEEGLEYQIELPEIDVKDSLYKNPIKIELAKGKTHLPYNFGDNKAVNRLLDLFEDKFDTKINYPMEIENKFNVDYYDLTDKLNDDYVYLSNVGGYPYFSNDPDLDYDVKEECMLFIGSDLDKGICFGADAGRFYVLITKEDLLNKNFENATCNFEF